MCEGGIAPPYRVASDLPGALGVNHRPDKFSYPFEETGG